MEKEKIFCLIGESGVGKTMVAEALEKYAGIPLIPSYTDRPPRVPGETGHVFLTKEQFDAIKPEEMIAFMRWGDVRYCCLVRDVKPVNTYVISEAALRMLQENYGHIYSIYTIRIYCHEEDRIKRVGIERVSRDAGKFTMKPSEFDWVLYNTGCKMDLIHMVWQFIKPLLP